MSREPRDFIGGPISALPTPAAVVHLPTMRGNIARMAEQMNGFGVNLRPHWKTTKSIEAAKLQIEAGAVGITVATANELRAATENGIPDVFWAYPPVGPQRVREAIEAHARARIIVSGDSLASLEPLAEAAEAAGIVIEYRLDIDTGLGRTGAAPENAVATAKSLAALPGLRLEGIYTHEGQVQGVGADPVRRVEVGTAAGVLIVEVAEALGANGFELTSVSVGSTPGAASTPAVAGITEARPGTYVYGDENQVAIGTIAPEHTAITVLSRVISIERDGAERNGTVLVDAGIKAMSSDGSLHGDGRIGTVVSSGGGLLYTAHEEHGFMSGSTGLEVGDVVSIRPNHACGLSNMHSHVYVTDGTIVTDLWTILGRH